MRNRGLTLKGRNVPETPRDPDMFGRTEKPASGSTQRSKAEARITRSRPNSYLGKCRAHCSGRPRLSLEVRGRNVRQNQSRFFSPKLFEFSSLKPVSGLRGTGLPRPHHRGKSFFFTSPPENLHWVRRRVAARLSLRRGGCLLLATPRAPNPYASSGVKSLSLMVRPETTRRAGTTSLGLPRLNCRWLRRRWRAWSNG
ncbi:hypothetical protein CSUI_009293 [Cystoisospora suis]|uniref:Uncharacterized protein n=1 Tax=Cystoisospora suis TaxID=483139 RepID=A0A2C6KJS5_9APIC|nr:hypothetical protein CSUI_009293 [Cystoisospora suis]